MVKWLGINGWGEEVFLRVGRKHPPLPPSKGEMRWASIHEQYDVGTKERLGKARMAERTGTSGTGESASRTGDCGMGEASGTGETGGNKKSCLW